MCMDDESIDDDSVGMSSHYILDVPVPKVA
jgi:hypothetical protein